MTPRRFLMATTFYPPYNFGGDGIFVRRLAGALARRGHEVHVVHDPDAYRLLAGAEPAEAEYRDPPGVVHHPLPRRRTAPLDLLLSHQLGRPTIFRRRLEELAERLEPEVIHFHNVSLLGGPGLLALGRGVKLCTLHDYWWICPMHVLWRLDREACTRPTCLRCTLAGRRPPQLWRSGRRLARMAERVDLFLAPSRFCLETHRKHGFPGRLAVLPHFAPDPPADERLARAPEPDPSTGPASTASESGGPSFGGLAPPARPRFVFAGRLERLKGAQDLIDAWRDVPDADLVVAGTGAQEAELRRAARHLPNVRFVGWTDREGLQRLASASTALVIPSLCYETFGQVAVEAWAVRTPVIVRRIGALSELVEEGGAIAYGSRTELIQAMRTLIDSPGERRRLAARGRSAWESRYTEASHLERYFSLIEEAQAGRARGSRA